MKVKEIKQQPANELAEMRQRITESDESEAERKRTEEQLRESERRYQELADFLPQIVFEIDARGNFTFANRHAFQAFGYTQEDFEEGLNALQMFIPEDRDRVEENIQRILGGEDLDGTEYTALRKDGSTFAVNVYSAPIIRGNRPVGLRGIAIDITERKRTEEELRRHRDQLEELVEESTRELREAQERFSGIFDSAKDAIDYATLEGAIVDVNDAFCQLTGYSREEWLAGTRYQDITPEEYHEYEARIVEGVKRTGEPAEYEKEFVRKDGSHVPVLLTRFVVKGEDGEPIGLAAIIRDETERKQMEERLLASERLATLGQFSGSISHELRNPLGVIDSSAHYLKTKLKDADEKVQQHLDRIRYTVGSATAIIDSLLNLTRMKEPQLAGLDLISVVHDAIVASGAQDTVNIIRDFPEQEVMVSADREQLRMAFKNIVKNAGEAMDGEGTLAVTVGTAADGQAEVSFTDNGPGIAPENLDKVFQPLFSTRAKGIGFGLAIVKTVIDKHGGTVEARSEPGKGAAFIIRLPLYANKDKEV